MPVEIWPLNKVRPVASETNNQLFARVAEITTSTPVPVETVASSDGEAFGVADVVATAVLVADAIGAVSYTHLTLPTIYSV